MIVSGANGWRIRKRMHGWRSIQIRPTIPLQLPTLQATKAIIDYSSDARAFNANTNFDFNCGPDVHRRRWRIPSHGSRQETFNKSAVNSDKADCDWRWKSSNASNKAICNSVNSFYTSLLSLAWIVTLSRLAILHTPPSGSLTSTVRPATTIMATIF